MIFFIYIHLSRSSLAQLVLSASIFVSLRSMSLFKLKFLTNYDPVEINVQASNEKKARDMLSQIDPTTLCGCKYCNTDEKDEVDRFIGPYSQRSCFSNDSRLSHIIFASSKLDETYTYDGYGKFYKYVHYKTFTDLVKNGTFTEHPICKIQVCRSIDG